MYRIVLASLVNFIHAYLHALLISKGLLSAMNFVEIRLLPFKENCGIDTDECYLFSCHTNSALRSTGSSFGKCLRAYPFDFRKTSISAFVILRCVPFKWFMRSSNSPSVLAALKWLGQASRHKNCFIAGEC